MEAFEFMKPILKFESKKIRASELGEESSVPDLLGEIVLQNNVEFHLEEDDEIYEGYGTRKTSYPYPKYNQYTRELKEKEIKVAVLENDFIEATFLLEFGGRLWSLIDKETNRNLLYTNDVIRFSNLAICNAWFSGGVEWNIGIIGHTPFTTKPLFTAKLFNELGEPVLRMYEYERVRQVEYQMDFWLGEIDKCLTCRMRVVNASAEVTPMYWWSNIAVPEYEMGRVIVPAKKAYTYQKGGIYKVDIPIVNKVDVTRYKNIDRQVDYFFALEKEKPKYIANIDQTGYGLLHTSTERLQSRKLFSWGKNKGSDRWQQFLTESAGRYIEIQAGLGKTQYGCIPMAPHTAWEWIEQYESIQLKPEEVSDSFASMEEITSKKVEQRLKEKQLEQILQDTKKLAKQKAELVQVGSEYAAFKNTCKKMHPKMQAKREMSEHLDYGMCSKRLTHWNDFIETGILYEPKVEEKPDYFIYEEEIYSLLKASIQDKSQNNWYAYYQLGLFELHKKQYDLAEDNLKQSISIKQNPWAYHALAVLAIRKEEKQQVKQAIIKGLQFCFNDISYIKEAFRILLLIEEYQEVIFYYNQLCSEFQKETRILYNYIESLHKNGKTKEAFELLNENHTFEIDDLREGEDSLGKLWKEMHDTLYKENKEVPDWFNFESL